MFFFINEILKVINWTYGGTQLFSQKRGKENRAREKEDICLISMNYCGTDNDVRIELYATDIQFYADDIPC